MSHVELNNSDKLRWQNRRLPGLTIEKMPSGALRIRVRDITDTKRRITIPDGLSDEQFMDAYRKARNGISTPSGLGHFEFMQSQKGFTRGIGDMLVGARQRAALRGCEFSITRDDLIAKLREQRGLCPITGVAFRLSPILNGQKRPNRMSVDRINRSGGYTPDNIRITTAIANVAMMDWEFSDFLEMCRAVTDTHRRRGTPSLREWHLNIKRRKDG